MTRIFDNCENLWGETVTVLAAASVSEGVPTAGRALVGVSMPAAWTAANLGFSVSLDGINWQVATDNGGNLEKAVVSGGKAIAFPSADALKFPFLRILSTNTNGDGSAVVQAADRVLTLLFARFLGGS
jgi:hypothetical protein